MRPQLVVGPGALVAVLLLTTVLGTSFTVAAQARAGRVLERAPLTTTTAAPTAPLADPPAAEVAAPPTTTAPTTSTTVPQPRFTMEPYRGLGAWFDVYDWTTSFARYNPALEVDAIDTLAAQGVQTLFIQASKWDSPTDVVDEPRFLAFVDRAHQLGISVVAWYLPTLIDPGRDVRRLLAIAKTPVDGLAIDIEGRNVADVAERNLRLTQVSRAVRAALPGAVIGAIPLEPVLMEDINPSYWPGFPWAAIASSYDVWLPMGYWTNRRADSPWRNAFAYTAVNIDRLRARIGQPDAPIHALGGIGDLTTQSDMQGFYEAALDRGAIGGSIYDFRTTTGPLWPKLLPFRGLRQ